MAQTINIWILRKEKIRCALFRIVFMFFETNSSAPTANIQCARSTLSIIWYMSWGFEVMDFPNAFLKSEPFEQEIYAIPPYYVGG